MRGKTGVWHSCRATLGISTGDHKCEVIEVLLGYRQDVLFIKAIWSPALVLPARVRLFIDFIFGQVKLVEGLVTT